MAGRQGKVRAYALFLKPEGVDAAWTNAGIVANAKAIPGVTVLSDDDGALARHFGVKGSGHVLVYDAVGRLRFSGGITAARGHEGDNLGTDSVLALLQRGTGDASATPVFGCPLFNPPSCEPSGDIPCQPRK